MKSFQSPDSVSLSISKTAGMCIYKSVTKSIDELPVYWVTAVVASHRIHGLVLDQADQIVCCSLQIGSSPNLQPSPIGRPHSLQINVGPGCFTSMTPDSMVTGKQLTGDVEFMPLCKSRRKSSLLGRQ
ncbi:hypothetical protein C8J56DRAFT_1022047 [Mycena floridula]|nr:hypothetical protein C8J56DRAFT_1022047 [Mycena floridula]